MEAQNRVKKVHEAIKVTPFKSSSSSSSLDSNSISLTAAPVTLVLTYFDTYWLKFPPTSCLLFYEVPDLTWELFSAVILPKLKQSLSLTLLHYLPLAGHMMWGPLDDDAASKKPAICYFPDDDDGGGVSVTVAESNADFKFLSGHGIREAVEFYPLVPQLCISDDKAEVIAVQITSFPNDGFSIGITTHHAVLDGKSATMFIKSWAYLCKQLREQNDVVPSNLLSLPPKLTPCFDRTLIKDPDGIDMVYVKHWMAFTGSNEGSLKVMPVPEANSNLVRMTFELTREDINKLRTKVSGQSKQLHLSTYVLTCAYVYVCLVTALEKETSKAVVFRVGADCRTLLDPPLPVNYFGNCVSGLATEAKAIDCTKENGVAFIADKLSDLIKQLKGGVIEGSEEKIVGLLTAMKSKAQARLLGVAGSNRFDIYGSDFGWGKPKKLEIISMNRAGAISLAQSRDGGGVEVGVILEKQQMEVFASLFVSGLNV